MAQVLGLIFFDGRDRIDILRSGRSAGPVQPGLADHYNRQQLPKGKRGQRTVGASRLAQFVLLLFSSKPVCFGRAGNAYPGVGGAVGLLIFKDFYEMWHRGLAQRR
ncbi:MAG: hypothetical protein KKD09_13680 [Gammaproteobacteria bacterium]|nr:hypothetical protein [Gammaproteobacteria bacterium]MBU4080757.1 hypothetical protein [Gammaproteobacteria bacterium]MBU4114309.1 hypothetical protein [Gammaproteobacteria bacterium]